MDKKTYTETPQRSPYLCCYGVVSSTFIKTALLSSVLILLAVFVILILIGSLYAGASSIFFFVSAAILLSAAAMLTLFYIWLNRKRTLLGMSYPSKIPDKTEISTVSGPNYYCQPSGMKSDFPMGPYLVMTLPRTNNFRGRCGTMDSESNSIPNTPKHPRISKATGTPRVTSSELVFELCDVVVPMSPRRVVTESPMENKKSNDSNTSSIDNSLSRPNPSIFTVLMSPPTPAPTTSVSDT